MCMCVHVCMCVRVCVYTLRVAYTVTRLEANGARQRRIREHGSTTIGS